MNELFLDKIYHFLSPYPHLILDGSAGRLVDGSEVFPCPHNCTMVLHAHISPEGRKIGPLVAAVRRRSLTPPT
jgi:hypothetical protein